MANEFESALRQLVGLRYAADAFRDSGEPALEADARFKIGSMLLSLHLWDEASSELARAATLFSDLHDTAREADCLLRCAVALSVGDRDADSLPYFAGAVAASIRIDNPLLQVHAQVGWMDALIALQRWEDIETRCSAIVTLVHQLDGVDLRDPAMRAHYQWARLLGLRGDANAALPHTRRAADLAQELGQYQAEAQMRIGAAMTLQLQERYDDALAEYDRSLDLANHLSSREMLSRAIEGMGTILAHSPEHGITRFQELSDAYARSGDTRREAACRHQLGRCLVRVRPKRALEGVEQFTRAAALFDEAAAVDEAAEAYYNAAYELQWLGLVDRELRARSFQLARLAADRYQQAANYWGKGLAEFNAAAVLLRDSITDPEDPRKVPLFRQSARSFALAGHPEEVAGSRVAVVMQHVLANEEDKAITTGLVALRAYERARGSIFLPYRREELDRQIAQGLTLLTSMVGRTATSHRDRPRWRGLVWQLEQAVKGRSFQDQRLQNETWNFLLDRDPDLRGMTRRVEELTERLTGLQDDYGLLLIGNQVGSPEATARRHDALRAQLDVAREELRTRLDRLSRRRSEPVELVSAATVAFSAVQSLLQPGELYLGFLWEGSRFLRVSVGPTGACTIDVPAIPDSVAFHNWLDAAKQTKRLSQ